MHDKPQDMCIKQAGCMPACSFTERVSAQPPCRTVQAPNLTAMLVSCKAQPGPRGCNVQPATQHSSPSLITTPPNQPSQRCSPLVTGSRDRVYADAWWCRQCCRHQEATWAAKQASRAFR